MIGAGARRKARPACLNLRSVVLAWVAAVTFVRQLLNSHHGGLIACVVGCALHGLACSGRYALVLHERRVSTIWGEGREHPRGPSNPCRP
jgi:hypothetical protein